MFDYGSNPLFCPITSPIEVVFANILKLSYEKVKFQKTASLSGIGPLLFYGTPIGVDFAYFIDKVCRKKTNFLGCLEVF